MIWPFSLIGEARLRKECLEEIVAKAKWQGLNLVRVYLNGHKPSRPNLGGNEPRIVLEVLKSQGLDYSIEFFVQENQIPSDRIKSTICCGGDIYLNWDNRYFATCFHEGAARFPEGCVRHPIGKSFEGETKRTKGLFIFCSMSTNSPIGEVKNPRDETYFRKITSSIERVQREVGEMQHQRYQQALKEWEKALKEWESVPMEEWKSRNKTGMCPGCDGAGGTEEDIGPHKNFENAQNQYTKFWSCGACNGSGRISARRLKSIKEPQRPPSFLSHYCTSVDDDYLYEKIKEIGPVYCKNLLVYARITPN